MQRGTQFALQIGKTQSTGWGLFAGEEIPENKFIIEYMGEFIDYAEFNMRFGRNDDKNFYFLSVSNTIYIDAKKYGNESRFANHSCEPNCVAEKWTVHSDGKQYTGVGLFALHKINEVSNLFSFLLKNIITL